MTQGLADHGGRPRSDLSLSYAHFEQAVLLTRVGMHRLAQWLSLSFPRPLTPS